MFLSTTFLINLLIPLLKINTFKKSDGFKYSYSKLYNKINIK